MQIRCKHAVMLLEGNAADWQERLWLPAPDKQRKVCAGMGVDNLKEPQSAINRK